MLRDGDISKRVIRLQKKVQDGSDRKIRQKAVKVEYPGNA